MNESISGHFGTLVREVEVVGDAATVIGLASDRNVDIRVRFEPVGALLQRLLVIGSEVVAVEVEVYIFQILLNLLLLGGRRQSVRRS